MKCSHPASAVGEDDISDKSSHRRDDLRAATPLVPPAPMEAQVRDDDSPVRLDLKNAGEEGPVEGRAGA